MGRERSKRHRETWEEIRGMTKTQRWGERQENRDTERERHGKTQKDRERQQDQGGHGQKDRGEGRRKKSNRKIYKKPDPSQGLPPTNSSPPPPLS